MKVGVNLPSQFPFGSTVQMLEVYEQVGFDSYWSPDHILGVFHPGLWSEIPLSDLAAADAVRCRAVAARAEVEAARAERFGRL